MIISVDKNLSLELTAEKYAANLYKAVDADREHLSRFLPWVPNMQSETDIRNYIRNCGLLYAQGKEVSFVIIEDQSLIGRIGLHHINTANKTAAIGYWLIKSAEGRGTIHKSCKAMLTYGFRNLGLNRIEIKAATENLKSQAIPLKLGFKKEGILRQAEVVNNKFTDLILYAMMKEEWVGKEA